MPTYTIKDPETGLTHKIRGDSPPTEDELIQLFSDLSSANPKPDLDAGGKDIFAGLSDQVVEDIKSKAFYVRPSQGSSGFGISHGFGGEPERVYSERVAKDLADIERLRLTNPDLVSSIEEMGGAEKAWLGFSKGVNTLARAGRRATEAVTGADFGPGPLSMETEDDKFIGDALKTVGGAPVIAGELAGQTLPFVSAGIGAGLAPSLAGRAALGATVGGLEGASIVGGEGGTPGEIAGGAAIGAATGFAGEVAGSHLKRLGRKIYTKLTGRAPKGVLIDDVGKPTPELQKVLDDQGLSFDQVVAESAGDRAEEAVRAGRAGSTGRIEEVAAKTEIDQETVDALAELGIDPNDAPVGFVAKDQGTKQLSAAAAAVPGSRSQEQLLDFASTIRAKADESVETLGGALERNTLDDELLESMQKRIDSLKKSEDILYDHVRESIPAGSIVNVTPIRNQLETIKRIRPAKGLGEVENKVYKVVKNPRVSYEDIDSLRKDIGAGFKRQGPFKDADQAELSKWYGRLTDMQGSEASKYGVGEVLKEAKEIGSKRFGIQESTQALYGKGLTSSFIPKLEQRTYQIPAGRMKEFKSLMDNVPEDMRQKVAASALQGVFAGGLQSGKKLQPGRFVSWFETFQKDPKAYKAFTSYLGDGGERRLKAMYKVSKSLSESLSAPKTGAIPDALRNIDAPRIWGKLANLASRQTVGGTVTDIASVVSTPSTSATKAVDDLITDDRFQRAIRSAIANGTNTQSFRRANQALRKSKVYKAYQEKTERGAASGILSAGLIPYLLSEDE